MLRDTETRPSRQARGRARKSENIIARGDGSWIGGLVLMASVPFCVIVVPRLMWLALAPVKGWC